MMWSDLFAACALYLVLEGIVPFLSPPTLRRALETVASLDDRTLRLGGLTSMIAGLTLLYWVRG